MIRSSILVILCSSLVFLPTGAASEKTRAERKLLWSILDDETVPTDKRLSAGDTLLTQHYIDNQNPHHTFTQQRVFDRMSTLDPENTMAFFKKYLHNKQEENSSKLTASAQQPTESTSTLAEARERVSALEQQLQEAKQQQAAALQEKITALQKQYNAFDNKRSEEAKKCEDELAQLLGKQKLSPWSLWRLLHYRY